MRLGLVALLAPALLVAGCGSEVKQVAATATTAPAGGIPWPVVTDSATPAALPSTPTASATTAPPATGTPSPSASAAPTASPSPEALGRNPLLLVGWWRVATSAGELDLGLGQDGAVVAAGCSSDVTWAASPTGLLVAASYGFDGGCSAQRPDLRWLESAWAFAVSKQRLLLVDQAGAVVARGVREQPPAGHEPYPVTPALKARLADSRQLPTGIRPVFPAQLARKWVPHGDDAGNGKAYVTFTATRSWTGSDGCNGAGGRFSLGDHGEFLTVAGPSTLIGCDSSPAASWVVHARRLGLDKDGALVLYDARARLLGRLFRR